MWAKGSCLDSAPVANMPKIVEEVFYNGARERAERLGLIPLIEEVRGIVSSFDLRVKEQKDSNGGAAVRKMIDKAFDEVGGWDKKVTGDLDWLKCKEVNGTKVCLGVEVQFSARSDLIVVDMIHLNAAFREARIDVGLMLVPSNRLAKYLTDRGPKIADAKRHVEVARLQDSPIILFSVEHDGPGPALPKQRKRSAT
jgi:hypothetical protein